MKSSIGLFYQLTVRDKNGKIVRKTRMRKSHSFCIAFLQLFQVLAMTTAVNIRDNLNSLESCVPHANCYLLSAAEGNVNAGIVLGIGITTPDNLDHVIETLIAHGSAATQINYAAQTDIAAQEVGANVDYQLLRSMQNLSGSTINVTEAGIYTYIVTDKYGMMTHDVFTAVPVANGQTITVTYTFRTTV